MNAATKPNQPVYGSKPSRVLGLLKELTKESRTDYPDLWIQWCQKHKRGVFNAWAVFACVCLVHCLVHYTNNFELVPDSDRGRYAGLTKHNAIVYEARCKRRLTRDENDNAMLRCKAVSAEDLPSYARIKNVLERLTIAAGLDPIPWKIHIYSGFNMVLESDICYFCIGSGFLKLVKSDDEIAAAISHELGHFIADHHREKTHWNLLISKISAPALYAGMLMVLFGLPTAKAKRKLKWIVPGAFLSLATMFYVLSQLKWACGWQAPWEECEADHIGMVLMACAGYDLGAAISYRQTLRCVVEPRMFACQTRHLQVSRFLCLSTCNQFQSLTLRLEQTAERIEAMDEAIPMIRRRYSDPDNRLKPLVRPPKHCWSADQNFFRRMDHEGTPGVGKEASELWHLP